MLKVFDHQSLGLKLGALDVQVNPVDHLANF